MAREGPHIAVLRRVARRAIDVPAVGLLADQVRINCLGAEAQWPLDDRRICSRRWTRASHRVPDWDAGVDAGVDCVLDQLIGGLVAALEEIGSVAPLGEGARHKCAVHLPSMCRVPTTYGGHPESLAPWRLCHDYPDAWETEGGALGVADRLVRPDVLLMPPSGAEHPWVQWADLIGVAVIHSSHVRPNMGFLFPRAELEVRCLGERMVSFERDAGARWAECYYAMVFRNPEKVATLVPMNPRQRLTTQEPSHGV